MGVGLSVLDKVLCVKSPDYVYLDLGIGGDSASSGVPDLEASLQIIKT